MNTRTKPRTTNSERSKKMWQDPEFRAKMTEQLRARNKSVKSRKNISDRNIKNWQSIEYKQQISSKLKLYNADEDNKRSQSERSKKMWQDTEFRDRVNASLASRNKSTVSRTANSEHSKKMWQDPEFRAKMSTIMKDKCNTPEFRAKMAVARENMPVTLTKPYVKVCGILQALGVEHTTEKALGPWNYDVFIPGHDLMIEVQGNYWHAQKSQITRDKAKATYLAKYFPGYRLQYVWEHECLQPGKVEAKIRHWLGLDKPDIKSFSFKDLEVRPVDKDIADDFLYTWHYQHHGRHGLDYGAFLGDVLVALARYTSPHRAEVATSLGKTTKEVNELSRFCIHPHYQVKNLATWLLARSRKLLVKDKPGLTTLVSFADSTYNHVGTIYKADNWVHHTTVQPNYWYIDKDGWVMHKKTLWNHAKKMSSNEADYAEVYGFTKIWGKEKYKYTKEVCSIQDC